MSTQATEERQEVRAEAKWVRISPRKARLVTDHIRGRSVPEARTVLAFTTRAAAREIEKVLRSAVANAEANHGLFGDDLQVSAAYVDEGPTIKRWRARARGRAARIHKRTCHITIKLAPVPEQAEGRREPEAEEKPKRTPRRRTKPKAETPKPEAAKAETPAAEDKPKPKRTTTRKQKEETTS
jgi:large subunit ribosomal protein L22